MIGELHKRDGSDELVIEWKIPNFFDLSEKVNEVYCSPSFSFADESWYMSIYPNGEYGNKSAAHISLYLNRELSGPRIRLEYSLGLKAVDDEIDEERKYTYSFDESGGYGSPRFLNRYILYIRKSELVPSGSLNVVCTIKYPICFEDTGSGKAVTTNCSMECSYCGIVLNVDEDISTHMQTCREFPIKCPKCEDVVALKNWHDHKCQMTGTEIFGEAPTKKCSFCETSLSADEDISAHLQQCTEFPIKCPKCADVVSLKNWHNHKCQIQGTEGGTSTVEFSDCETNLEGASTPCYDKLCMGKPLKCSKCCEVVPMKDWFEHKCLLTRISALEKLLDDLKKTLMCGAHSDIVVKVKGEELRLHKNILGARNPFFDSIFKNEIKDVTADTISIDDCEPQPFRSLIHYIYTGTMEEISLENVCDLYETAVTYQEELMKAECLQFMMSTVSIDNFCDYTVLALRHDETELFQKATEVFTYLGKEIIRNAKWKTFLEKYPAQASNLLMKMLNVDNNK